MPRFDNDDIDALFNAVICAGLATERTALFADIPPLYFHLIPAVGNPASQVRVDLGRLNNDPPLADGHVPFHTWLRNALMLTKVKAEGEVFRGALIKLDHQLASRFGEEAAELAGTLAAWPQTEMRGLVQHRLKTRAGPLGTDAHDSLRVVSAAAKEGWLDLLLVAILSQRIDDAALVRLAEARGLLAQPTNASPDRLQQIVRQKVPFQDVEAWRTNLARREATVARVELQVNTMWKPGGTGFLVGPDLLLTNHHVVKGLIGQQLVKDKLRFRFDFKRTTDGSTLSDGILSEPADQWLVVSAPHSPLDELKEPGNQEPAEDHLDFALIRLASPMGRLPIGAVDGATPGRPRGWMRLVEDTALTLLGPGQSVFILQHPDGDALQIGFGDFLVVGSRRVRYDANTLPGSSGAPCLDARLDVVALHHAGDTNHKMFEKAGYNQGIPIHLIVAMCKKAGVVFEQPPPEA